MPIKDESGNVWSEPKKKGPKPAEIHDRPIAPVAPSAPTRTSYQPRTTPAPFQKIGFGGSIFDFNARAEAGALAFESQFGYEPSPGLLLDIVRSPTTIHEFEDLFDIPQSFARARAQAALNDDEPELTGVDESQAEQVAALEAAESGPSGTLDTARGDLRTMGISDSLGMPGLAARQIGESLFLAPFGVAEIARAVGTDVTAAARGDDFTFKSSRQIAKEIGEGIVETYRHPSENPGYIFLDVLGVVSVVAGGGARVARAKSVAKEGAAKRDVVKALVRRPPPQRGQLNIGDFVVEKNLSDAAVWRTAQKLRLRYLQRRLNIARQEPESGFQRRFTRPQREIRKLVSPEATVRRLDKQRRMAERVADDNMRRELLATVGPSVETSKVVKRLPKQVRRSLTRGEHKAIFVQLSDVPGTFEEKASVWRGFHENQIAKAEAGEKGIDTKAHSRHLRDLTLSERAWQNQRSRFQKALALSDEVSAAQQIIKIEKLGLDPVNAETRIASLGALARGELTPKDLEAGIPRMKPVIPESRYTPTAPKGKRRPLASAPPQMRAGELGVSAPKMDVPELTHRFDGKAIYSGNIRVDTPHLLADAYARTVRAAARLDQFDELWRASVPAQLGDNYVALLPKGSWPDEIKAKMRETDEGALVEKELQALSDKELNEFWNEVVVEPRRATGIPGVRWVDEALIPEHVYYPKGIRFFAAVGAAINEPVKAARLFLVPRYMLNALGNVGTGMLETVAQPKYVTRAVIMEKRNPKIARAVAAHMGEGKMVALNPMDFSVQRYSNAMGRAWGAVTDRAFRGGNFYYWAERKGYKTDEDLERLLFDRDEKTRKDLVEVEERGNKGMVDFRNQSPVERNIIRHWIFVYPWLSRSFVWGMRTMLEHPQKTWTLSQLGRVGAERSEEFYADLEATDDEGNLKAPKWYLKGGYYPVSVDEATGLPNVLNFNSVNSFGTINDFLNLGESLVEESPYDGPDDYLSPVAEFGIHFFTGKDELGRPFESGRLRGAFGEAVKGIPHVTAFHKWTEEDTPPDDNPLKRPPFIPGFANTWGSSLAGGLIRQTADLEALEARYWRDNPEEKKAKTEEERVQQKRALIRDEIRTLRGFEEIHEKLLGRRMPEGVRSSLRWQEKFTYDYAKYAIEVGRVPTAAEKREIEIDRLFQDGRISLETQLKLKNELGAAALAFTPNDFIEASDLTAFTKQFRVDYLNAEEVSDWYDDRNIVLRISKEAPGHLRQLREAGLWQGKIPSRPTISKENLVSSLGSERGQVKPAKKGYDLDHALYEYGRKYVEFDHEERNRSEIPVERSSLETLRTAEHRAWLDKQDEGVSVGGQKLPSFVRLDWALKDEDSRLAAYVGMSVADWSTLSNFEKEIVGRKPAPGVSMGWLIYEASTGGFRGSVTSEDVGGMEVVGVDGKKEGLSEVVPDALAPGARDLSAEHKLAIAKWIDTDYAPGFLKDYKFAIRPKYQRVSTFPPLARSPNKEVWIDVLEYAHSSYSEIAQLRAEEKTGIGQKQDEWKDYVTSTLFPWLETNEPEFVEELGWYGGVDFLRTMID